MTTGSVAAESTDEVAESPGDGLWPTAFHAWTRPADFESGTYDGGITSTPDGGITLGAGTSAGQWTSGWHTPTEAFSHLVPSWQADTPAGSWVEIELQVGTATTQSQWFAMGTWAFDATAVERQSVAGQSDAAGQILTDTFVAAADPPGGPPATFRLRATLHGGDQVPTVRQLAVTTARPGEVPANPSEPLSDDAVELAVPPYSQSVHSKEYPDFGGGGQVWCSPTSTSMVLSYWGTGPDADDVASLPPDEVFGENERADGQVAWAAIHSWDYVYTGAGNWAFNTAYASAYGLDGSVRQYSTLREVEQWVRRGVPVVVSIGWDNKSKDPKRHLDGSSIKGTAGHIMVVVGFTADGDVIANDPASPSNDEVRHVYRRDQFERNWLRASNGTTYIIKDGSIPG